MEFNVAQLLKEVTGAVRRYQLSESLEGIDPELVPLEPMTGELRLMRTNSGILAQGAFQTTLQMDCKRCIEPAAYPVTFELEESFRPLLEVNTGRFIPPEHFEGTEDELEDAALIIDVHHILNIQEVVRQAIWLALPLYPDCDWTGEGICPRLLQLAETQDVTLHFGDEEESGDDETEEEVDPRWAALLKLRAETGDTENK